MGSGEPWSIYLSIGCMSYLDRRLPLWYNSKLEKGEIKK